METILFLKLGVDRCNEAREPKISCSSSKVLLAFTWLSCITRVFHNLLCHVVELISCLVLSYLVGLVVCAVHHSQGDSRVWCNGVRDYRWFTQRRPVEDAAEKNLSYGRLVDPREPSGPPTIYAQQMGLSRNYAIEPLKIETTTEPRRIETTIEPLRVETTVEPLRIETTIERPVPPVPTASSASRAIPFGRDSYRFPRPTPPSTSVQSYSLYPQHLQATVGNLPVAPIRAGGPSPPPTGPWPRSNPQEPLRKRPPQMAASGLSANQPPAPDPPPSNPEMEEQGVQGGSLSSAARSRPSGPRTPASASRRPRPPPLDLSQVSSHNEPER